VSSELSFDHAISRADWDEIASRLREPFDPADVDFRVQGRANEQTGRAQVVAYIDARAVQDRLDAVVGAGNWSFDWTPLVIDKGEVMVAKGTIIIHGVAKSDAGSASNFEQSLGAVSHCFKRAAVHWGIGRYLYNLPMSWVSVEKGGRIPEGVLRELRVKLPRPAAVALSSASDQGERVVDSPVDRRRTAGRERQVSAIREPAAAMERGEPARVAPAPRPAVAAAASVESGEGSPATEQQLASIRKLCGALGKPEPEGGISYTRARELLTQLSGEYQRSRRAS
jgi:hypothetical protein